MNLSTPTCKFFTSPLVNSSQILQNPQYLEEKEYKAFSDNESALFKKPRICENATSGPKMPACINSAMAAKFKNEPCANFRLGHCSYGSKCRFFHGMDDMQKPLTNLGGNGSVSGNFKTQLCTNYRLGDYSSYGSTYQFAYGTVDVRMPLRNLEGTEVNANGNRLATTLIRDVRMKDQSRLCKMFNVQKACIYGDKCRFLHTSPENIKKDLGQYRVSSAISIGSNESSWNQRNETANSKPVFRKRKLCRKWEMMGWCAYGKTCCFAHGLADLGTPVRNITCAPQIAPNNTSKASLSEDTCGTNRDPQEKGVKLIFKGKEMSKIIGIYADWTEDMPLLHGSINKVEN